MLGKGSLSLLSCYEGDSSDDDVPGPRVSTKRLHKDDSDEASHKRLQRLPIPPVFMNTIDINCEYKDNPSLHEGRQRSFPHERGNWTTYIYIPYVPHRGVKQLVETVIHTVHCVEMKEVDHYHLSLTKTVILKHHWITSFIESIKDNVTHFRKFIILFCDLKVYCNEERTRTFVGLQIKSGFDTLLALVKTLDKCLAEFKLPPFYEEPSFHISIAWCVGDFEEELNLKLAQLNSKFQELLHEHFEENWYIYVEHLLCKTGNKYFQFYLT